VLSVLYSRSTGEINSAKLLKPANSHEEGTSKYCSRINIDVRIWGDWWVNYEKWHLGTQVTAIMVFIALAAGIVGAIGILGIYQIQNNSTKVYQQEFLPLNKLSDLRYHLQVYRSSVLQVLATQTPEERGQAAIKVSEERELVDNLISSLDTTTRNPEEEKLWQDFKNAWTAYGTSSAKTVQALLNGETPNLSGNSGTSNQKVSDILEQIVSLKMDRINSESQIQSETIFKSHAMLSTVLVLINVILSLLIGCSSVRLLQK